jgi:hypothetical protein
MVPKKMLAHGSPGCEMALLSPRIATNDPEMGIHNPASRSIPATIPSTSRMADSICGPPRSFMSPEAIIAIPATSRRNRRPTPGQPWANVEYRRRRSAPSQGSPNEESEQSPKRVGGSLFRVSRLAACRTDSINTGMKAEKCPLADVRGENSHDTQHGFHDSKYRLHRGFALRVYSPAFRCRRAVKSDNLHGSLNFCTDL